MEEIHNMAYLIQLRRDTAANWTSVNPILASGELGIETGTLRLKIGDGSTVWASLPYYSSGYSYKASFTNASLSGGVLTVNHNLGQQYATVQVFDNNNNLVVPDNVCLTSSNVATVTLVSFGVISGTYNVVVIG